MRQANNAGILYMPGRRSETVRRQVSDFVNAALLGPFFA
jgi:hypothetical protein